MLKVIKRSEIDGKKSLIIRVLAVILALLVSGLFLAMLKFNPILVYGSMIKGAFGSTYSVKETILKAIPLVIASLGIAVAFKMQFWNIGGEGQMFMGAFFSAFFALKFPDMPKVPLLTIMLVSGFIGGAIWGMIPAYFKAKWGTNETIVTLMMNYIALKWVTFLQYGPWKDKNAQGFPKIPIFSDNATLPSIAGIHIGFIIALILVVVIYIFMEKTKKGYEISVLGESRKTALYAGININKTIIIAMLISGGLCGLTGMIQSSAISNTLSVEVTGGVGNTAIIIAWLAALKPQFILITSVLFAALVEGGTFIQTSFGIPDAVASILQATILFFVLGSEFFIRYKVVLERLSLVKERE